MGLQALIVEFAGDFAATVGLNWEMWILCILLGSVRFFTLTQYTNNYPYSPSHSLRSFLSGKIKVNMLNLGIVCHMSYGIRTLVRD